MNPSVPARRAGWPTAQPPAPAPAARLSDRGGTHPQAAEAPATDVQEAADPAATPWTRPFLLVLGYLFIDYARPQDWFSPLQALRPGMLVLTGGILSLLYYKKIYLPKTARFIIAFLCVMGAMVPFATNNFAAYVFTKDFAIFIFGAVIPLMTFVTTTRQISILFRFWVAMNVVLSLYGITHGGRGVGSFLGDENDFSLALNVGLPYAFFFMGTSKSTIERLAMIAALGLAVVGVVTSLSRGGFVGLISVGLMCWLLSPKKIRSLLIVLATVGILTLTVSDSYWAEMQTIKTADQEGDTGYNRIYFWGIGWHMFLDHPILGVGPANFQYNSFDYEDPDMAARGFHVWGKAAHSLYFTLLPEEGIVGVFLFLSIMFSAMALRRGVRKKFNQVRRKTPSLITPELHEMRMASLAIDVSLIGYLVSGAFISVLYYPHFWLNAAFSVALKRVFDAEVARLESLQPAAAAEPRTGWPGASRSR
jgi:probable O-glycosylation ligase (exosortase A-associated)